MNTLFLRLVSGIVAVSLVADPAIAASRWASVAPRASNEAQFTAQALEPRTLHHSQVIAGPSDPKMDALQIESRYYDLEIRSMMPAWLIGGASTAGDVLIKFDRGTAALKGSVEELLARSGLAEHVVIALGELTQVDDSIPGTLGIMLSRHSAQYGSAGMALELATVLDRLQGALWPNLPAQPTPLYAQAKRLERSLRKAIESFQSTGTTSAFEDALHEVYRALLSAMPAEDAAEMPSTYIELVETENPAFLGPARPLRANQWFALLRMLIWQFNRECLVPAGGFLQFYVDPETLSVALRPVRHWSVYAVGAHEYLFVDIDDKPHSILPSWTHEGVDVNEAYVDDLEMWQAAPRELRILRNHRHPLLSVVARRLAVLTPAQWVELERRRIRRRVTLKAGALVRPEKPITPENLQSALNPDGHSRRIYVLVEEGLSAIRLGGYLAKDELVMAARYAAEEIDLLLRAPTPVDQQARLFHLLAANVKFHNDEPMTIEDWAQLAVLRSAAAFMANAKPGDYYMDAIEDSIEKLARLSPQSLWSQLSLPPPASSPTSSAPLITSQSQAPTGTTLFPPNGVNQIPSVRDPRPNTVNQGLSFDQKSLRGSETIAPKTRRTRMWRLRYPSTQETLRERREAARMTQQELGKAIGRGQSYIRDLEEGAYNGHPETIALLHAELSRQTGPRMRAYREARRVSTVDLQGQTQIPWSAINEVETTPAVIDPAKIIALYEGIDNLTGPLLRTRRLAAGIDSLELERATDVSDTFLRTIEQGKSIPPTTTMILIYERLDALIAQGLRERREAARLKIKEIASKVGKSANYYGSIEKAETVRRFDDETLQKAHTAITALQGKKFKLARQAARLDQAPLAQTVGASQRAISEFESGKRPLAADLVSRLFDALENQQREFLRHRRTAARISQEVLETMSRTCQSLISLIESGRRIPDPYDVHNIHAAIDRLQGHVLRLRRGSIGVAPILLAKAVGISRSQYQRLEMEHKLFDPDLFARIHQVLSCLRIRNFMAPLSVNEEIAASNWKDPEALLLEQEEQHQVDRQTQHVESLLPYLADATLQGVLLRTLHGDIPEEIGARLGLSVDAVKRMIQEGAMKLRELVAQHPAPKVLASAA